MLADPNFQTLYKHLQQFNTKVSSRQASSVPLITNAYPWLRSLQQCMQNSDILYENVLTIETFSAGRWFTWLLKPFTLVTSTQQHKNSRCNPWMYYMIPFYMAGTTSRREAIGNLPEAAIEKWCLNTARFNPYVTSARYHPASPTSFCIQV